LLFAMNFIAVLPCAQAEVLPGVHLERDEWEIACDNTRMCRAAGYQGGYSEGGISVLLTREAGPSQPVTGKIKFGTYDVEEILGSLPFVFVLSMHIDDRAVGGQILIRQDSLVAELSSLHVDALLAALQHNSKIKFVAVLPYEQDEDGDVGSRKLVWRLSVAGATAVLSKMDSFQGRIGTQGAIIKKGLKDENLVLPQLTAPIVRLAPLASPRNDDNGFADKYASALQKVLRSTISEDNCYMLRTKEPESIDIELSARLKEGKMLVTTQCWGASYNFGYGYWVVNDKPPFQPVLVTTSGSNASGGIISAVHRGRGMDDCREIKIWVWDGTRFIQTESSTTGMCKMFATGGGWSLPTLTRQVLAE